MLSGRARHLGTPVSGSVTGRALERPTRTHTHWRGEVRLEGVPRGASTRPHGARLHQAGAGLAGSSSYRDRGEQYRGTLSRVYAEH
ncbi:hypothetical protein NDU88_007172 [Pleurodeles waltl]|uniref:Uncharacterized protein n=1 Tax=Pleurodeles waltl TaxID=8319 RepID=A0AAV7NSC8_PLEWA|nr:hypothetical protein NDU88_007172 [Pleurodeles waltl]